MIEVWIDNGEAFFCLPNMINLHIRTGTVSKEATKLMDLPTNSMEEAHRLFQEHLQENSEENQELVLDGIQEGWD